MDEELIYQFNLKLKEMETAIMELTEKVRRLEEERDDGK